MVIGFQHGGICYIRDGTKCYLSETLRREFWITDGELNVESKQFEEQCIFVTIDFKKELVRFKDPEQAFVGSLAIQMGFNRCKDIPFTDVLEIRLLKPNGFFKEK